MSHLKPTSPSCRSKCCCLFSKTDSKMPSLICDSCSRTAGFGVCGTTKCRRAIQCRSISSGKACRLASMLPMKDLMANLFSSKVRGNTQIQVLVFPLSTIKYCISQSCHEHFSLTLYMLTPGKDIFACSFLKMLSKEFVILEKKSQNLDRVFSWKILIWALGLGHSLCLFRKCALNWLFCRSCKAAAKSAVIVQ